MSSRTIAALLCAVAVFAVWTAPASAQIPVERGRYLVEVLGACGNCHTPKGPTGDQPGMHLAGGFTIVEAFGSAVASNITTDLDTGIGRWTDEQIIAAIREGKRPDGRILGPPMPFALYRRLSDADARAIVAYLRTVTPVRNQPPPSRYTVALPASYGPPVGPVAEVPRTDLVRYGEYLAGPVAHCVECHSPPGPGGMPDLTRLAAGGFPFPGPWGTSYSTNLTPDPDTGIGKWADGEIIASLHGARRGGGAVLPPMPWPYFAAGLDPDDVTALVAYLRSLPAIRNAVPAPKPPGGG